MVKGATRKEIEAMAENIRGGEGDGSKETTKSDKPA
jgi:hypothetical protein